MYFNTHVGLMLTAKCGLRLQEVAHHDVSLHVLDHCFPLRSYILRNIIKTTPLNVTWQFYCRLRQSLPNGIVTMIALLDFNWHRRAHPLRLYHRKHACSTRRLGPPLFLTGVFHMFTNVTCILPARAHLVKKNHMPIQYIILALIHRLDFSSSCCMYCVIWSPLYLPVIWLDSSKFFF